MMHKMGDKIVLTRKCKAILIPDGTTFILEKSECVYITQVLGGMFTVESDEGRLLRIDGKDADALSEVVPDDCRTPEELEKSDLSVEQLAWNQIETCYDPEIPVNMVDLGLIYKCTAEKKAENEYEINVEMTLTAPGCGMGEVLKADVISKLSVIPKVTKVNVELVLDPPWDSSMMSDAARLQLGLM